MVQDLAEGRIDAVTFTSSSTAHNFVELIGRERFESLGGRCCLASIGPITSGTIREYGARPSVEAEEFTIRGLVAALQEYFQGKQVT